MGHLSRPMLGAWVLAAEEACGQGRAVKTVPIQEGFQESGGAGLPSQDMPPAAAPRSETLRGCPNPWPACWGTLTGLGSASAPPCSQAACPREALQKWPWLVLQPRTWGSGERSRLPGACGQAGHPGRVPSRGLDHTLGQSGTPPAPGGVSGESVPLAPVTAQRQTEEEHLENLSFWLFPGQPGRAP